MFENVKDKLTFIPTQKTKMGKKSLIRNIILTLEIMTFSTVFAYVFFIASYNSTSVAFIYVLAVMMVARWTEGYVPGIIASLIGVICVNYVFTYPYMQLNFSADGYPVTFLGLLIVSGLTSTLTTNYKKQNELLINAEKETMRANLLRAVSHDLRTPLTSIIGMAATYRENAGSMSEKDKNELVANISEDANWLLNMVENLLSVTRINVSDAHVNTSPEPVEEVVSEAVVRLRKRLPNIRVKVKVPEEFLMVPMDATLIEQVIINLCENSFYHSGVNSDIDLYVLRNEGNVEFHIRDYGKGISPDRIEKIFDGAGFDPNASGDAHKGMGIGLTICKTIVNAHHGEIRAINCVPGVEFLFTLPMRKEVKEHE